VTTKLTVSKIRLDGGTQPRAEIDPFVVDDYAAAMNEAADFPAIVVFYDGKDHWLADGFHRVQAAIKAGLKTINADVRQGMRRDAVLHSVGANASHGLRRTNADKRRAVETLLRDGTWSTWADREIARRCSVSHDFVNRLRKELSLSLNDSEPRTYTTKHGTTATMNTGNIGGNAPVSARTFVYQNAPAPIKEAVANGEISAERAYEIVTETKIGTPKALQMSESNEWYTPATYINAARQLMGAIDLDPASNPFANQVVQAAQIYTINDSGLAHKWAGRVWLNPPYGREEGDSNQAIWSARLIQEFCEGNVTEAVLLVNAVTDRVWFQPLWDYSICFTDHRIKFYDGNGEAGQPTHGNVLVYFGTQRARFIELFSKFGVVVERAK